MAYSDRKNEFLSEKHNRSAQMGPKDASCKPLHVEKKFKYKKNISDKK